MNSSMLSRYSASSSPKLCDVFLSVNPPTRLLDNNKQLIVIMDRLVAELFCIEGVNGGYFGTVMDLNRGYLGELRDDGGAEKVKKNIRVDNKRSMLRVSKEQNAMGAHSLSCTHGVHVGISQNPGIEESSRRGLDNLFVSNCYLPMDTSGWDNPPVAVNTSGLWSIHQHEIGENFISLNSNRVSKMIRQLAPALDSINVVSNFNLLHRQEAIKLAADTVLANSGAGTTWGEALTAQLCSSPLINRPCIMDPLSSLMADLGAVDQPQVNSDCFDGKVGFKSLDCFLSDCRNLWNFDSIAAISSGESEYSGSNSNESNKEMRQPVIDPDVQVSPGSWNPYVSHERSSDNKPNSPKRSKVQQEINVGTNYHYFDLVHESDSSTTEGSFRLISKNLPEPKNPRSEKHQSSSCINFQQPNSLVSSIDKPDTEAIAHMKEMIYRAAAFRPVNLGLEVVDKPKRKNVRISSDPQTVAARQRRERISERIRVLQRLVPGGSKMDTASMLDEAANYLKFLRSQVKALEILAHKLDFVNCTSTSLPFPSLQPPFSYADLLLSPKTTIQHPKS
ncbi:hypothetical protein HHK36_014205 [Tetracentron sinense]|uniref:BHLH domain-containing protein n=1 Tax=Tetracentron sinense TaxID=13715 RepID=A0A834Z7K7_TETSI|nr:hypothetical protein HHK36_014205 [Tetracentron sinense]